MWNDVLYLLMINVLVITVVNALKVPEEDHHGFSLRHVIPAKEALKVVRESNTTMIVNFLTGLFEEKSLPAEPVTIQTREEYTFELRSELPIEEEADYRPFFGRIPALLPKPEDHETILSFAKMAANSYLARSVMDGWRNTTNYTDEEGGGGFGWNSTGLRGHIFTNEHQTIVIISFKGTSTILNGGETVARDKYMDNMIFSCCCARVDITWTPICNCYQGGAGGMSICDGRCLSETVKNDSESYFQEGLAVTKLVMTKYPRAQIWFTGHSLGGAIAALMTLAFNNTAAITFSSPGPYLYARHLGLDNDTQGSQWRYPIWNFGLSSDPIFTGDCTKFFKSCYLSGYAMETSCRHGMDCIYPISSWQPDVSTHRIDWFIDNVLVKPEKYPLPVCLPNRNCTDCPKWAFVY